MSVPISKFYQTSLIFWKNLIVILLQFIKTIYWRQTSQNHNKPQTEKVDNLQFYNMVSKTMAAFVEEEQKRIQLKAQEHAKVALLHQLLVQHQMQDLQRRRLLRLALAQRRLEYSY